MYAGAKTLDIKDLSGGINAYDGASEIFDNQGIKSVNFTVEGNKLISAPGFTKEYTVGSTNNPVQGLYVDPNGNVYSVQNNQLYKNGARWTADLVRFTDPLQNSTAYTVTIGGTPYTYTSDGSATRTEIANGLKAVIDAGAITGLETEIDYEAYHTRVDADATKENLLLRWSVTPLTVTVGSYMVLQARGDVLGTTASQRVNIAADDNYLVICAEDGSQLSAFRKGTPAFAPSLTATNCRCVGFYLGCLMVGAGNAVYNSKVASDTAPWKVLDFSGAPSNSRKVGNTANVVGFAYNNDKFFIGKDSDSIWTVTDSQINATTGLLDMPIKPLTATGPVNQSCMTNVQQDVLYFDGRNVRRISYEANTLALKDAAISVLIEPLIRALPESQSVACASFRYPYYNLHCRSHTAGSTECDTVFKYQVEKTSWSVEDGKTVRCATASNKLSVAGSTFDGTVWKMDTGDAFDSDGRDGEFRSKLYDMGDNVGNKRFFQIQLVGAIGENDEAILDVYTDSGNTPKYSWAFGSNGVVKLTGTLGTLTLGTGTLGSGGSGNEMLNFAHRFSMFADGPAFSFGIRYSGYTRISVDGFQLAYKKLRTHNFRNYA